MVLTECVLSVIMENVKQKTVQEKQYLQKNYANHACMESVFPKIVIGWLIAQKGFVMDAPSTTGLCLA